MADVTQQCETPMSDHVARFWRLLETEHVRILVDIRRDHDEGQPPHWDSSSFGDDVAKALVVVRRQANVTQQEIAQAIRKGLVENWKDAVNARQWDEDVLLTGCRKVRGGVGYQKPEEAAQRLAIEAAGAVLALLAAAQCRAPTHNTDE